MLQPDSCHPVTYLEGTSWFITLSSSIWQVILSVVGAGLPRSGRPFMGAKGRSQREWARMASPSRAHEWAAWAR